MIVRYSLDDISPELSAEEIEQLNAAAQKPIIFDEDCPEVTPEMAKRAYRPGLRALKNIV